MFTVKAIFIKYDEKEKCLIKKTELHNAEYIEVTYKNHYTVVKGDYHDDRAGFLMSVDNFKDNDKTFMPAEWFLDLIIIENKNGQTTELIRRQKFCDYGTVSPSQLLPSDGTIPVSANINN